MGYNGRWFIPYGNIRTTRYGVWFLFALPVCAAFKLRLSNILMAAKNKVSAYVDGFNLYHAIDDINIEVDTSGKLVRSNKKHHLKWLNLRALLNGFIQPQHEE